MVLHCHTGNESKRRRSIYGSSTHIHNHFSSTLNLASGESDAWDHFQKQEDEPLLINEDESDQEDETTTESAGDVSCTSNLEIPAVTTRHFFTIKAPINLPYRSYYYSKLHKERQYLDVNIYIHSVPNIKTLPGVCDKIDNILFLKFGIKQKMPVSFIADGAYKAISVFGSFTINFSTPDASSSRNFNPMLDRAFTIKCIKTVINEPPLRQGVIISKNDIYSIENNDKSPSYLLLIKLDKGSSEEFATTPNTSRIIPDSSKLIEDVKKYVLNLQLDKLNYIKIDTAGKYFIANVGIPSQWENIERIVHSKMMLISAQTKLPELKARYYMKFILIEGKCQITTSNGSPIDETITRLERLCTVDVNPGENYQISNDQFSQACCYCLTYK